MDVCDSPSPGLFALASDLECSVRRAWHDAWALPMPAALSDQWTSEFLRLQELLVDRQPSEGQDGWTGCEPRFSVRAAYRRLRAQAGSEDLLFLGHLETGLEKLHPVEDPGLSLASSSSAADDEITPITNGPQLFS